jgi:hypothetical protein
MTDQELEGIRAVLTRLEAAQAQHSEALRAATGLWAEQIGYLRARTQGIGENSASQRADVQTRLDELHAELAKLNALSTQSQLHAQHISQLDREQGRISMALTQLADAHTELLEHIERHFDHVQDRVNHHTGDIRWLIVAIILCMGTIVALAFVVSHGDVFA